MLLLHPRSHAACLLADTLLVTPLRKAPTKELVEAVAGPRDEEDEEDGPVTLPSNASAWEVRYFSVDILPQESILSHVCTSRYFRMGVLQCISTWVYFNILQ